MVYFTVYTLDRQIDKLRLKTILGYGLSSETGEEVNLAELAKSALQRKEKEYVPLVAVGKDICHKCSGRKYIVTGSCESCIARPCIYNCPKHCISRVDGKAKIDSSLCIRCGTCARVCPYNAIHKQMIPCEEACPVNAITKDAEGNSVINFERCIHCGKCMVRCPFGAILMPSQVVDVCREICLHHRPVVGMLAPALLTQFACTPAQLHNALRAVGFAEMVEVAAGADVTSLMEAEEFLAHVGSGKQPLMTTSCCPSFYQAVHFHVPALAPFVSHTGSPMHYTAELVKRRSPDAFTVFLGPCVAKRAEGMRKPNVDAVLTAEELLCIFVAKGIDCTKMSKEDPRATRDASCEGTFYAVKEGVASAVKAAVGKAQARLEKHGGKHIDTLAGVLNQLETAATDECSLKETPGNINPQQPSVSPAPPPSSASSSSSSPNVEVKPFFISPLDRQMVAQLKKWGDNPTSCPYNLIECMACDGGCVGGPGTIVQTNLGVARLKSIAPQRRAFDDIEDVLSLEFKA